MGGGGGGGIAVDSTVVIQSNSFNLDYIIEFKFVFAEVMMALLIQRQYNVKS